MDEIRRKLELIDRQLAGRNYHRQIITTCPLVFVAVGLIGGILIQSWFDLTISVWLAIMTLLSGAAVLCFLVQQFSWANRQYVTAYLALACFVCLGAVRLTTYRRPAPDDIRNLVTGDRRLATIRGRLITDPHIDKYPDWEFARFKPTDPTSSFYLNLKAVETSAGWVNVCGTLRVQVGEPVLDLKPGDDVQAYCWLERFSPPTNPGQFDTAAYLARRNIYIAASVQSRDGIELLHSSASETFAKLRVRVSRLAATALLGDLPHDDDARGLLAALLIGAREDIDSDTYRAFRTTGLLHFVSLSGMHMGILVAIIWWLCKTAGFMKPARAVICLAAIAVFLMVVPSRAPTLRAAVIGGVFCASLLFRRYSNPVNTLALAAIVLLLVRPTELSEAGWQLSFAAVLGIILFAGRIDLFLAERVRVLSSHHAFSVLGRYLLRLFSAGLAAWLGGAGILLYHFYTITPLACVWTVLVFPLVAGILVLGFLKMILFFLLPTLGACLGIIVILMSDLLVWLVKLIAQLGVSQILIGSVPVALVILYYCMIAFTGFASFRRPWVKRAVCAAMILVIAGWLGGIKWQRIHRDDLIMTCLDVGHGQAILVQLPGTANILFDAGSLHRSNIGSRIVSPFLDYTGTGRIDAIIISHNDADHINGIPEIVSHCRVGGVYANDAFFDRADSWGTAQFLTESLDAKGLEIQRLPAELNLNRSAEITILWPAGETNDKEQLTDNDRSLVTLIKFAGRSILLCSDIETFAQKELLRLYPDLRADVVVVPHHGSAATLDKEFLESLDADVLIYSCDPTQYERIARNAQSIGENSVKVKAFYTAENGATSIRITKNGILNAEYFPGERM